MAFGKSENYQDQIQESVQETGVGPNGESQELNRGGSETSPEQSEAARAADVNEDAVNLEEPEGYVPEAHQVEPDKIIFVPFEDFDGRINQTDFSFQKGVAVKITRDEANTWLDAEKGYIK